VSQSRLFSLLLLTLGSVLPLGAQVPHPYLTTISPVGGSRGKTVTVMLEGVNLSGASAILFDKPHHGLHLIAQFNLFCRREQGHTADGGEIPTNGVAAAPATAGARG
jgi:hypothetical protein